MNDRYKRFYCTNVANCSYAAHDHVYSHVTFKSGKGLCIGLNSDGCGQQLTEGAPYDPRPVRAVWATVLLFVCAIAGAIIKSAVFPDPINGIAFVSQESSVQNNSASRLVHVRVKRTGPTDKPISIKYKTESITAVAVQDFEASEGTVTIDSNKQEAEITLVVHSDPTNLKPDRSFAVVLTNVEGLPHHYITIAERKADPVEEDRVRAVVRSTSRLAKDIADEVVRRRVFNDLLSANRDDPLAFSIVQAKLQNTQDNLIRSRELYVESLRSLQSYPPRLVVDVMETVSNDQEKAGYNQQAQATMVMKAQFQELLKDNRPYLDRWSEELSKVIPPIEKNKPIKMM